MATLADAARAPSPPAPPREEADATLGLGEAGAEVAAELSRWLAQALVEERLALRSALERTHREGRDALDEELGRRYGALAARLQERCQEQHARRGPEEFQGIVSESEHDGHSRTKSASSVVIAALETTAPHHAAAETDDGGTGDKVGQSSKRRASLGAIDPRGPLSREPFKPECKSIECKHFKSASARVYAEDVQRTISKASTEDVQRRVSNVLFQHRETQSRWRWAEFVEGARFELIIGLIIMLNGLQMAFEVQYSGLVRGYDLGYREYAANPNPWPGAEGILKGISIFFGVVFACEVALKIFALRDAFFKSYWNLFDLLIVLCFVVELFAVVEKSLADTTMLRLARLARLLRLVRVVRQIRSFDALFLMTTAIRSSAIVLAWSCMLLFMIQVLVAFTINQLLEEFYFRGDHPQEELEGIFEYWGSFSRALLSTFEMTLANWPPVCRMLMEYVSEWFMVICLFHKLTVGFAVIGIINGVFIQETFRVAAQDDFIMMHQKEAATRTHMKKMERLFKAGDTSGNGFLDKTTFLELIQNVEVKTWLSSMGLEVGDADALFEFMDADGDRTVNIHELVRGVNQLKGTARSLDLMICLSKQDEMYQALLDTFPEMRQHLKQGRSRLSIASMRVPTEDANADTGPSSPPATATLSKTSNAIDLN